MYCHQPYITHRELWSLFSKQNRTTRNDDMGTLRWIGNLHFWTFLPKNGQTSENHLIFSNVSTFSLILHSCYNRYFYPIWLSNVELGHLYKFKQEIANFCFLCQFTVLAKIFIVYNMLPVMPQPHLPVIFPSLRWNGHKKLF